MGNNVFIHLGPAKTGTSAIQHFLSTSEKRLLDEGYVYMVSGRCAHGSHNPLAWILYHKFTGIHICKESKEFVSQQDKILYDFTREIDASQGRALIVSSETFPALSARAIDELIGHFKPRTVKAVIYIRDVRQLCLSLTLQHIKEQNFDSRDLRMKRLFDSISFDYQPFVDLWAKMLGKRNIIFRKYGKDQFTSGNIYADILETVGIDIGRWSDYPESLHNVSLKSAETVYFKDILNRMNLDIPESELIRILLKWEQENKGTIFDFPESVSSRINVGAEKTHDYLLQNYLGEEFAHYFDSAGTSVAQEDFQFTSSHLLSMLNYMNRSLPGFDEAFLAAFTGSIDRDFEHKLGLHNLLFQSLKKATELHLQDRDKEAVDILLECIRLSPQDQRPYLAIANIYIEAGLFKEALDVLQKMQPAEDDLKAIEMTGRCMEKQGEPDEALKLAEHALSIDPESAPALNLLGVLAFRRGDPEEAKTYFDKAIEACPAYAESYSNLGAMKWDAERPEALEQFEKGFILAPAAKEMILNYHAAIVALGEFERAERVYREASSLYPHSQAIKEKLVDSLIQQNKEQEASEVEKRYLHTVKGKS